MPIQPTSLQLIDYLEKYKGKNSAKLGVALIDLLLLCDKQEDFEGHTSLIEVHISNLITVLKDFEILEKICKAVANKASTDFQKSFMCYLTNLKDKTNRSLLDYYMDEHLGANLNYLLDNDLIDPARISSDKQSFIEYFIYRESNLVNIVSSIHFFEIIIRQVVSFSKRFHLPHPLYAYGDFSPLACILEKNLSFAYDIINIYDKYDWKKELFFKMPDGIIVSWIPFLPKNYTEISSLSFVTNKDIKGDIKNITQLFIESLANTDLEETAKDVLFNSLKYQSFFDVLTQNLAGNYRSLLVGKNVLQQQIILHKHRNKKLTALRVALDLQRNNFNESDFFHHYEMVQAILSNFSVIRHLLDDVCIEDLKQVVDWYKQIFDYLEPAIKTRYLVQSGRNFEHNDFHSEIKQELVFVAAENEVKSELNFLLLSLKDPHCKIKKNELDKKIADLTIQVEKMSNKKFRKSLEILLKEIDTLKSNLVEFKNGILKYPTPVTLDCVLEKDVLPGEPPIEEKIVLPETPIIPAKPIETMFHFFQPDKKTSVLVNPEPKLELKLNNEEVRLA